MLEVPGDRFSCCDGLSRRSFLRAGYLGLGALTLPQLIALRRASAGSPAASSRRDTSVIYIELAGGPSHFETYDPKPDAPSEYRGPLGTVATSVPGIHLSELMVEQAKVMDKLAIVRSVFHRSGSHGTSAHLVETGYYLRNNQNRENEMPSAGAVTARVKGANAPGIPAFVAVPSETRYGGAAYLGQAFRPFITGGDPNRKSFRVRNLSLERGLTAERIAARRDLLSSFDAVRRIADTDGVTEAMDEFHREALAMVTGDRARAAFDIDAEDDRLRERYGRNRLGQSLLLARRLVEAGVSFVTVRAGGWDDHNQIDKRMKSKGPDYDRGVAALVADIYERGLEEKVLVVAMGEFGRTPRVNRTGGRDHWGRAMSVLLSGGGLRVGQVVGATNAKGEMPVSRPYRPENVLATVYRHLGIDPGLTFEDLSGRPRHVLEESAVIDELV